MEENHDQTSSSPEVDSPIVAKKRNYHLLSISLIIITLIITTYIVKKYRNPMQMSILDSGKPMDMASMGGQTGYLPVMATKVTRGDLTATISYTGSVLPYTEQIIYPRVSGRIVSMPFYPGDKVKRGQLLITLDSEELSSRYDETKYSSQALESESQKSISEYSAASSRLLAAHAESDMTRTDLQYWKKEIKRQEYLYKNGAVSKDEYENELAQYQSALAKNKKSMTMIQEAQQMLTAAKINLAKSQTMIKQGQAQQKTAAVMRDYTRISSPIDGVISERIVSPGTLVEPGMMIMKIVDAKQVRIQVNIPTSYSGYMKKGNILKIHSQKNPDFTKEAPITSIFPAADPVSRTTIIEAVVNNQDHFFVPGDFVSVEITTQDKADILKIPTTAILQLNSDSTSDVWIITSDSINTSLPNQKPAPSVYYTCVMHPEVISDKPGKCPKCGMELVKKVKETSLNTQGTVHLKKIITGIKDATFTEVISGLNEGDTVITKDTGSLQEGDKVKVVTMPEKDTPPESQEKMSSPIKHDDSSMPGMNM